MDDRLREMERRWLASGEEADRFAWLCQRWRLGWGEELAPTLRWLEDAVSETFDDPDAVGARCVFGFVLDFAAPVDRLSAHVERAIGCTTRWFEVPPGEEGAAVAMTLDVTEMVGLYPHRQYETGHIAGTFMNLFEGGTFFANFDAIPYRLRSTSLGSFPLFGAEDGWELSENRVIGAVLGPLVGFISVNARDTT